MTDVGQDPVAALRRWADAGAVWQVVARTGDTVTVALFPCTGGEEIDRFTSSDPDLLSFLGDRTSNLD